jgi:AraC-like DNA-binding protein
MRQSKQLISVNALSLNEVAFMVGFSSLAAFYRAFTQWKGFSPSDWALQTQKQQ